MQTIARALLLLVVLLGAVGDVLRPARHALAQDAAGEPECSCEDGFGACQHFLKNPMPVPEDPCWCDKCRSGKLHDGLRAPRGWNQTCFSNGNMTCYLKRHAAVWGIACSECIQPSKCCPFANTGNCPDCAETSEGNPLERDWRGKDAKAEVAARLQKDAAFFKKPDDVVLAWNKHFYVVTDISGLKVKLPSGMARPISKHEWVHLTIERAEYARREWVRHLGEPGHMKLPIAMYFCAKQRDQEKVGSTYFGSPNSNALVGSAYDRWDNFCTNGMSFSEQKYGGDHELMIQWRHQLAHNLLSCWGSHEIRPKSRPQWMEEGLGHWLTKITEPFEDDATYCVGEQNVSSGGAAGRRGASSGGAPSWSGKDWHKDVAKLAATDKLDPIEKLLAKQVTNELKEDDHKRAWSLIALCLKDWREPSAKVLAALRQEKDVREAFVSNLGITPEQLDERWRERVTGKRRTMATEAADASAEDADGPGSRDRKAIANEQDVTTLAARIRQLGEIADAKTVAVVLDQIARPNDLVRETSLVTLLKTKDDDARAALWKTGLSHAHPMVRAYTAKICGRLQLEDAIPKLEAQLADDNWYARAEAAVACARLKHASSMALLRKMVTSDPSAKAQVAAMDALAMFGEDAHMGVPLVLKHLSASEWQLRVAACDALGAIGSMEAVDPLIERMQVESGRVQDAMIQALKAITRDDLGRNPENWRKWWEGEKAKAPGGLPRRPDPGKGAATGKPEEKKKEDPRYAAPEYYGVEIYSNRVGFVVDTSASMKVLFVPDARAAKVLSREYTGMDKITICKEEVAQALEALDDRSHFTVVTFGTMIRAFKSNPVAATPGNVQSAVSFLKSIPANGETNYYDALRVALDLGEEPDTNPNFRSTPDTITFLTDGEPTKGAITDGDTLVEWYTGLNRYARVVTHTVTFGNIGIDMPLLHRLATQNGGKFTLVPELKK